MRSLANIQPSIILASLVLSAKLTNGVSRQSLRDANIAWVNHINKVSRHRDQQTLLIVADQLRLIITQVVERRCRIHPIAWPTLVKLETDLRNAHAQRINLEPLLDIVAANTEHSEVA